MPARSSTSSVLRWPDAGSVLADLRRWVEDEVARHPELLRLAVFGSYARGDSGVGSDIDLVAIVDDSRERFDRRALSWRTETLPLPTELLVYTSAEWRAMAQQGGLFARTIEREAVWLYDALGPR